MRSLSNEEIEQGIVQGTEWGTSQGSPLSPVFANVLLDALDKALEKRGHRFVRYMDDIDILVKSPRVGKRVMASICRYLSQYLKLKVNPQKTQVVKVESLEFLGFTFRGIRIFWSDQSFADFKHRLRG
jgi:RNA-directed DNA polymerase